MIDLTLKDRTSSDDLSIVRGKTYTKTVTSAEVGEDFTSYDDVIFRISADVDTAYDLELAVGSGVTVDVDNFTFTLTGAQTDALTTGLKYFELDKEVTAGVFEKYIVGNIEVKNSLRGS